MRPAAAISAAFSRSEGDISAHHVGSSDGQLISGEGGRVR